MFLGRGVVTQLSHGPAELVGEAGRLVRLGCSRFGRPGATITRPARETFYELHGREVRPGRPGSTGPAAEHVNWHRREVFKGAPLAAAPQ